MNSFKAMVGCITGSNFVKIGEENLEVIALTRFCIVTYKCRSKVGQGHSSSNSSKAMVGCITGSNLVQFQK